MTAISRLTQTAADLLVGIVTWRATYHAYKAQLHKMFGRSLASVVLYDGGSPVFPCVSLAHAPSGSIYVVCVLVQSDVSDSDTHHNRTLLLVNVVHVTLTAVPVSSLDFVGSTEI